MAGLLLEEYIPVVMQAGVNSNKAVDFSGAPTAALPAATTIGGQSVVALSTITSDSANALTVGPNGTTNPVFNVDASTSSQAAGLNLVGATSAGTVALAVISSGNDANLSINALGSGTVTINGTATGGITLGRATVVTTGNLTLTNGSLILSANASQISFTGTGANGGVLKNLKNAAASALSGTQLDIEILIGATPYYFTVYPTKA